MTGSLVKPLAFTRPTGHNLILEWDIFYPLPVSWRKPEKPAPKPKPTELPNVEEINSSEFHDSHHAHHPYEPKEVWTPSGGWSSENDVIKSLSESDDNSADRRNGNVRVGPFV